nr:hypothetical protein [Candidatus Sigynarchaeum springense]
MSQSSNSTLYFTTRIGPEKKTIPFPANDSLSFLDVVSELCKKLSWEIETLSIATPAGNVLTASDLNKPVGRVKSEFGTSFEIIDQGDVGARK